MRISYKLTKRTTKTGKTEKFLKKYNIINVMTIRYKLTASGNIVHTALDYKLMRPVNILRLQRRKNRQKRQIQKKLSEKCRAKSHRKCIFQYKLFYFHLII